MLFNNVVYMSFTAQKMKKSFMENFTFNAVFVVNFQPISHIFLILLLLTFKKLRFIK